MHVQVKEVVSYIYIKGLNYVNIGPWKGRGKTPDRPFLDPVSLCSDENNNKSMLRVCNRNLTAEM